MLAPARATHPQYGQENGAELLGVGSLTFPVRVAEEHCDLLVLRLDLQRLLERLNRLIPAAELSERRALPEVPLGPVRLQRDGRISVLDRLHLLAKLEERRSAVAVQHAVFGVGFQSLVVRSDSLGKFPLSIVLVALLLEMLLLPHAHSRAHVWRERKFAFFARSFCGQVVKLTPTGGRPQAEK